MRDTNYPLRKIYYSALNGLDYNGTIIKAFYHKAPDSITDEIFIVFGGINNTDTSTQTSSDTDTSMRVTIHTFESKYNNGRAADDVAGLILTALYPNKQTHQDMSADGVQLISTKLTGDFVQDSYNIQGAREYLDRILTFTHELSTN